MFDFGMLPRALWGCHHIHTIYSTTVLLKSEKLGIPNLTWPKGPGCRTVHPGNVQRQPVTCPVTAGWPCRARIPAQCPRLRAQCPWDRGHTAAWPLHSLRGGVHIRTRVWSDLAGRWACRLGREADMLRRRGERASPQLFPWRTALLFKLGAHIPTVNKLIPMCL